MTRRQWYWGNCFFWSNPTAALASNSNLQNMGHHEMCFAWHILSHYMDHGSFWSWLDLAQTGKQPTISKTAELGVKSSLYWQPLHSRSNLLNLNLRIQYHKILCKVFSSESLSVQKLPCGPNIKANLPYYWVTSWWYIFWPADLCFTISIWVKIAAFFLGTKYFMQELSNGWSYSNGSQCYLTLFF